MKDSTTIKRVRYSWKNKENLELIILIRLGNSNIAGKCLQNRFLYIEFQKHIMYYSFKSKTFGKDIKISIGNKKICCKKKNKSHNVFEK